MKKTEAGFYRQLFLKDKWNSSGAGEQTSPQVARALGSSRNAGPSGGSINGS
ncbi:hypothetical protein [Roseivivax marinus]|uniref:hypothetical protein n=1 Tax=Roseivivax marinus TaxID=1379903 RepID=UPI00138E3443|nr:hypothetical protein [Roseivivax marinus]